jgi:hypothetical protein
MFPWKVADVDILFQIHIFRVEQTEPATMWICIVGSYHYTDLTNGLCAHEEKHSSLFVTFVSWAPNFAVKGKAMLQLVHLNTV